MKALFESLFLKVRSDSVVKSRLNMNAQLAAEEALILRDALASTCQQYPDVMSKRSTATTFIPPHEVTQNLGRLFAKSQVLIWDKDVFEASKRGHEVFNNFEKFEEVKATVNEPVFWHLPDFYYEVSEQNARILGLPPGCDVGQFLIFPAAGNLYRVIVAGLPGDPLPLLRTTKILPNDGGSDSTITMAQLSFLRLKLPGISTEKIELPRATRRRAKRNNVVLPEIRIIALRERESSDTTESKQTRTIHHSWIRSGGWVNLPEPLKHDSRVSGGRKGDKIIWRRAAMCGKGPLLPPRENVYSVAR